MQFKAFAGAAVLLALAQNALSVGTATLVNNCGYPIYFAAVNSPAGAPMTLLQGSYSYVYSQPGVGVSIKFSPNNSLSMPLSQFEFTWANGKIAYDLSNINGYPFAKDGIYLAPSMQGDASNPTCVPVNCPAGASYCSAAYNQPNDVRTLVCNENANLVMTVCPNGSHKRDEFELEAEPEVETIVYRVHARHMPRKVKPSTA